MYLHDIIKKTSFFLIKADDVFFQKGGKGHFAPIGVVFYQYQPSDSEPLD